MLRERNDLKAQARMTGLDNAGCQNNLLRQFCKAASVGLNSRHIAGRDGTRC
ncbi:hypothetical protein RKLH11_3421 [Rhodobacteraceae bacterium KLH11]|nr:hypothetical protein RKLH11_3421 [Rhodobacteraceae bacterium KLH11]